MAIAQAHPARAMNPEAVTAVASRLSAGLPHTSGWTRGHDSALGPAVANQNAVEALDPEPFAARHHYDVTLVVPATESDPAPRGGAIDELLAARDAVSFALAAPDAIALAAPLVRLASAACDLADPFLTTSPDADEVPGAHSLFSDTFDPLSFVAADSIASDTTGLAGAGEALASNSAALRQAVEDAASLGDDAGMNTLRNQRLEAAIAVARLALREAVAQAAATMTARISSTRLAIWPNPTRGSVRVSFVLTAPTPAQLEVIDVSGRRVIERRLGTYAAGEHSLVLEAGALDVLPFGLYFVRVHAGNAVIGGRLFHIAR